MPKLSIITINLNNLPGLAKTISSVIEQSFKDYEYIVIDGGSTDGSTEEIEKNKNHIAHWISEKDKGIYNAQNKGIELANGEYCLFLNSGDSLNNANVLETVFKTNPIEDIVYGDMMIDWGNGNIAYGKMPKKITLWQMYSDTLWHPVSFIKRTLFQRYGNYNENYKIVADYDFFFKAIIKHKALTRHIELPIAVYNTSGISSAPENREAQQLERKKVQETYLASPLIAVLKSYELFLSSYPTQVYYRLLNKIRPK